jgi:hypothetical protein
VTFIALTFFALLSAGALLAWRVMAALFAAVALE